MQKEQICRLHGKQLTDTGYPWEEVRSQETVYFL